MAVVKQSYTIVTDVTLKGLDRLNIDPSSIQSLEDVKKVLDDLLRALKGQYVQIDTEGIEVVTDVTE